MQELLQNPGECSSAVNYNGKPVDFIVYKIYGPIQKGMPNGGLGFYSASVVGIPREKVSNMECRPVVLQMAKNATGSYSPIPWWKSKNAVSCFYAPYGSNGNELPYIEVDYYVVTSR